MKGRAAEGPSRVFLTGAFGNIGEWVLRELLAAGHEVFCFDKLSPATHSKAAELAMSLKFTIIWGDLTDSVSVMNAVEKAAPTAITHVARVTPPLSIKSPALSRRVNVEGTRNLVAAACLLTDLNRFVMVSNYSVHGPVNPTKDPSLWTGNSPLNPQDDYACHMGEAEAIVGDCGLPFCIVRLCAVFPVKLDRTDVDASRFSFLLPYDGRGHAIDVRDAGLAIANATIRPDLNGRQFVIGGGEGWYGKGGELRDALFRAIGLRPLPREAYRLPDPIEDSSWFYDNWVDTSESQTPLNYQRYSFNQFLVELKRNMGLFSLIAPFIAKRVQRKMLKQSPWYGKPPVVDARAFADAARDFMTRPPS